jgi:UDP-glucose 4-epimerase
VAIAERIGVERFVLASSAAVYGEQGAVHLREDAPLDGSSVYARSKIAAEEILEDSGIPHAVSLRIFNVWGPEFDSSLVERLRRSEADHPITLTGWTEFVRDYVHADDVAEAIGLAVTSPASFRGPVNVGTGEGTSTAELVRRLEVSHPVSYRVVDGEPTHSVASIARATSLWEFAPVHRVPDGVPRDRSA